MNFEHLNRIYKLFFKSFDQSAFSKSVLNVEKSFRKIRKRDKSIILSKPYYFSKAIWLAFLPETNQPVFVTSVKLLELKLLQDQHLKKEEESS